MECQIVRKKKKEVVKAILKFRLPVAVPKYEVMIFLFIEQFIDYYNLFYRLRLLSLQKIFLEQHPSIQKWDIYSTFSYAIG